MPTLRSKYSLEQFIEIFQNWSHKVAMDAVTNLKSGDIRIIIRGPRIDTVETGRYTFCFYPKHVLFAERKGRTVDDWFSVDIFEKLYLDSDHSTKVEFWPEKNREKVNQFIEKLMSDAGKKAKPRFELSKFAADKH